MADAARVPSNPDYVALNFAIDKLFNNQFRSLWTLLDTQLDTTTDISATILTNDACYNVMKTLLVGPYPDGIKDASGSPLLTNLDCSNSFLGQLYQTLYAYSPASFGATFENSKLRVLVSLPDGTVLFDSSKRSKAKVPTNAAQPYSWNNSSAVIAASAAISITTPTIADLSTNLTTNIGDSVNAFAGFNTKQINENHNSRAAIISAILGSGIGCETKYSTTDKGSEMRVSRRIGATPDRSVGVVSVSWGKASLSM